MKTFRVLIGLQLLISSSHAFALSDGIATKLEAAVIQDQAHLLLFSTTLVDNSKLLRNVISEIGWPSIRKYGAEVEANALVLCLHAENDRDLQIGCLRLVKKATKVGDAPLSDIAYLTGLSVI